MSNQTHQPYSPDATGDHNLVELADSVVLPAAQFSLYDNLFQGPEDVKKYLEQPLHTTKRTPTPDMDLDTWSMSDDFNLAAATLQAEATGTKAPLIREDLRYAIQRRRRVSGLEDLQPDYKVEEEEKLNDEEQKKRDERRSRNKMAARKCRVKKKLETENLLQEFKILESKNTELRRDIRQLQKEREKLSEIINMHMPVCRNTQVLPPTR